uniref:Engrailed homeobox 1b n=1 Tax=Labrus bergylta TaxID=56723 RepID=A0A3Q3FNV3_9LABR
MEEQKEPKSGRDSTEEESMSLSPNLPSPAMIIPHQAAQQAHRTTNFFIDNILRPDFGCRKEQGYRDRSQMPGRENVNPLGARLTPACLDSNCSSDSTSSSPSSSSSSSSSTSSSPSSKQNSSKQGEAASNGAGRYADSPSSIMVMSGSNGGSPPRTKDSAQMLWPAWVYCTRYSDRPSSGKANSPQITPPGRSLIVFISSWNVLIRGGLSAIYFQNKTYREYAIPNNLSYLRDFSQPLLLRLRDCLL